MAAALGAGLALGALVQCSSDSGDAQQDCELYTQQQCDQLETDCLRQACHELAFCESWAIACFDEQGPGTAECVGACHCCEDWMICVANGCEVAGGVYVGSMEYCHTEWLKCDGETYIGQTDADVDSDTDTDTDTDIDTDTDTDIDTDTDTDVDSDTDTDTLTDTATCPDEEVALCDAAYGECQLACEAADAGPYDECVEACFAVYCECIVTLGCDPAVYDCE